MSCLLPMTSLQVHSNVTRLIFVLVFALLRLDPTKVIITSSPPENTKLKVLDPVKLINHALDFEVYDFDYPKLRKDLFEKHLKERLAQAKAYAEQAKKEVRTPPL